jgi:hypothetical protein
VHCAASPAAVPDVHVVHGHLGSKAARYRAPHRLRVRRAFADRGQRKSATGRGTKSGDYTRDYVSKDDADAPAYNVFACRDGVIRHFWSSEMGGATADPGQDSPWCPGYRSALDHSGHHARGARHGLVSKFELLTRFENRGKYGDFVPKWSKKAPSPKFCPYLISI